MIAIYITLGIFYLFNLVIFMLIHVKKTGKELEFDSRIKNDGMVSLFNNESIGEPLLNQFV